MGWWRTGKYDDLIGDGPVDTLTIALQEFANQYKSQYHEKPSLQDVLNVLLKTLQLQPENYICDSQVYTLDLLVSKTDSGLTVTSNPNAVLKEESIGIFHIAFEEISVEYQDSELDRKPRLRELLAILQFILGYQPDYYLSDIREAVKSIEVR
jgi:hypothetical protein